MKLTAESTDKIVHVNGVPARVWNAVTEGGVRCTLLVTRVAVAVDQDGSEFERELSEHAAPTAEAAAWPLRMVL